MTAIWRALGAMFLALMCLRSLQMDVVGFFFLRCVIWMSHSEWTRHSHQLLGLLIVSMVKIDTKQPINLSHYTSPIILHFHSMHKWKANKPHTLALSLLLSLSLSTYNIDSVRYLRTLTLFKRISWKKI